MNSAIHSSNIYNILSNESAIIVTINGLVSFINWIYRNVSVSTIIVVGIILTLNTGDVIFSTFISSPVCISTTINTIARIIVVESDMSVNTIIKVLLEKSVIIENTRSYVILALYLYHL